MSLFTILPASPVPLKNEGLIPFSSANFLANGEIFNLPSATELAGGNVVAVCCETTGLGFGV